MFLPPNGFLWKNDMKNNFVRIIIDIGTFIAVIVLPWWLSMIILIILIVYFPVYIEAMFLAFLFDTLYADKYRFPYIALTSATIFLLLIMFVKTRIRR